MADPTAVSQMAYYQEQLEAFYQVIERCIENADWDALNAALVERQSCLEQLFNQDLPQQFPDQSKQLAQAIMTRDAVFMAKVQQQKQLIMDQQSSLEQGKRALKAYMS